MKYFSTLVISFVSIAGFCLGHYLFEKWKPSEATKAEMSAAVASEVPRVRPYDIPGSDTLISADARTGISVDIINNDLGLFIVVRHNGEVISVAETHASKIGEGRRDFAGSHVLSYEEATGIKVMTDYSPTCTLQILVVQYGRVISVSDALVQ